MTEPTDTGTPANASTQAGDTAHIPSTGVAANPQEPVTTPPSQSAGKQSDGGQPPEGFVEQARFDGAMRTLQERERKLTKLEEQMATLQQQLQEAATTTGAQEANFQTQIAGLQEQVTALTGERDEAQQTLTAAQADLVKYDALREFPELLPMADQIPSLPDKDTMVEHLKMLKSGVDKVAEDLAARKVAGMTPGAVSPANGKGKYAYTTTDQWMDAMDEVLSDRNATAEDFKKLEEAFIAWQQTSE